MCDAVRGHEPNRPCVLEEHDPDAAHWDGQDEWVAMPLTRGDARVAGEVGRVVAARVAGGGRR